MAAERSYKNVQQLFVSNLNGTSTLEISLVTSFTPLYILLRSLLWQTLASNRHSLAGIFPTSTIFMLEYVTLVLPTLLVFTILADYAFTFIILLLLLAATGLLIKGNLIQSQTLSDVVFDEKKRFLCNFRTYVNIATAVSILAVDFSIYPRRFAKTETYGTGLMDVGVGSFIVANSLVSQEARGTATPRLSFMKSVIKELRAVLVLFGLGLLRFAAVKTTDYQEHVSEYGVHWNFFLTLACVRVLSTVILRTLPECLRKHPWIIGIFIGLFYQRALMNGLEDFILNGSKGDGSRSGFVDANREGICSSLGYLALCFMGVSIGKLIFQKYDCIKSLLRLLLWLVSIALICWTLLWYWGDMRGPEHLISRRLANLPFVLWQIGYNLQLLVCFLVVDVLMVVISPTESFLRYPGGCCCCSSTLATTHNTGISQPAGNWNLSSSSSQGDVSHTIRSRKLEKTPSTCTNDAQTNSNAGCSCLISAVNYNLLAYFLIANLFTGIVNLCIETIHAPPMFAFAIMNLYLIVLHAVITLFYKRRILLKL